MLVMHLVVFSVSEGGEPRKGGGGGLLLTQKPYLPHTHQLGRIRCHGQ